MNVLEPLRTYSSPSRRAVEVIDPKASEPELGSVMAHEPIFSRVRRSSPHRSFWAIVPLDMMAAADVLVHSTAGLTVLEAWMLGCRPISYGWGVGHVRLNNRAFRRFGLADVVASEPELRAAIARALAAPRVVRVEEFARLPAASQVVLELTAAGRESLAARA